MNKSLALAVAGVMLLGLGCKSPSQMATEKMIEAAAGGKANVDVNGNTIKVETKEGTAEFGGNKLPDNWASDAPVYPGATIQFSGAANPENGKAGTMVMLQTKDSGTTVLEYYKKELESQGWKINGTYQAGASATLAATKDNRTIGITIAASGEQTMITVGVSTK